MYSNSNAIVSALHTNKNSNNNTFSTANSALNSPRMYSPGIHHDNLVIADFDEEQLEVHHKAEVIVPKLKGIKMLY